MEEEELFVEDMDEELLVICVQMFGVVDDDVIILADDEKDTVEEELADVDGNEDESCALESESDGINWQ